jgi:hypothetical protein
VITPAPPVRNGDAPSLRPARNQALAKRNKRARWTTPQPRPRPYRRRADHSVSPAPQAPHQRAPGSCAPYVVSARARARVVAAVSRATRSPFLRRAKMDDDRAGACRPSGHDALADAAPSRRQGCAAPSPAATAGAGPHADAASARRGRAANTRPSHAHAFPARAVKRSTPAAAPRSAVPAPRSALPTRRAWAHRTARRV